MIKRIVLAVVVMLAAAGAAVADERMYIDGQYCPVTIVPQEKYSGAKNYAIAMESLKNNKAPVQLVQSDRNRNWFITVLCEFTSNTQYNEWVWVIAYK